MFASGGVHSDLADELLAQQRFYDVYRKKHGVLRPFRQRALMGPNAEEPAEMLRVSWRRDKAAAVERARRIYLAVPLRRD